jgi:hypothetical protein
MRQDSWFGLLYMRMATIINGCGRTVSSYRHHLQNLTPYSCSTGDWTFHIHWLFLFGSFNLFLDFGSTHSFHLFYCLLDTLATWRLGLGFGIALSSGSAYIEGFSDVSMHMFF